MPNVLREHGFVFIIAILLIAFISYFIYDSNKYNVTGQEKDGEDVVMSIDKGSVTSDQLYDKMLETNGLLLYNIYRNEVINQTVKTTDALEKEAKKLENNILNAAKQQDAENYETILETELATYGFDSIDHLYDYSLVSVKEKKMNAAYVDSHFGELIGALSEKRPRTISVITMDVANPEELTEDEQKKKDDIDASIESQGFAKSATAFSEDYTASDKGVVGYIDNDSAEDSSAALPTEVISAALELEQGATSDWINVINEQLGTTTMYKVHVDTTDVNEMQKSKNDAIKDQLLYAILNNNTGLSTRILQQNAEKIKVKFKDEALQKKLDDTIQSQLNTQEEEQEGMTE